MMIDNVWVALKRDHEESTNSAGAGYVLGCWAEIGDQTLIKGHG